MDVEIQLETPEIISGRVLNEDGVPIQNVIAQVQVLIRGNPESLGREKQLVEGGNPISAAKTDANGEFYSSCIATRCCNES